MVIWIFLHFQFVYSLKLYLRQIVIISAIITIALMAYKYIMLYGTTFCVLFCVTELTRHLNNNLGMKNIFKKFSKKLNKNSKNVNIAIEIFKNEVYSRYNYNCLFKPHFYIVQWWNGTLLIWKITESQKPEKWILIQTDNTFNTSTSGLKQSFSIFGFYQISKTQTAKFWNEWHLAIIFTLIQIMK